MNPIYPKLACFKTALLSAALLAAMPAAAQSQKTDIRPHANRIIGEELTFDFTGVTHEGAYNFTDAGDPRRFYTETTDAEGGTQYSEEGLKAGGNWFMKNDTLCFCVRPRKHVRRLFSGL